jgi:hypothetical protein
VKIIGGCRWASRHLGDRDALDTGQTNYPFSQSASSAQRAWRRLAGRRCCGASISGRRRGSAARPRATVLQVPQDRGV